MPQNSQPSPSASGLRAERKIPSSRMAASSISGDVTKAIAAGASAVMIGSLFAGRG